MTVTSRGEWTVRLNAVPFAPSAKARALLDGLGPEGLSVSGDAEWARVAGLPLEAAGRWRRQAGACDVEGEVRRVESLGGRVLFHGEPGYPAPLASVADAPLMISALGRLEDLPAVAVVGSRVPTAYGRRMARSLAAAAARRGVAVVSGLARGVDAVAHEAALDAGGTTWAVLGSGLGEVYPPENRDLARRIADEGGCVLSEYPCATTPAPGLFPRRNRIVAALSWATVVVEGRAASGSLLTAKNALEYGRDVLAVPGPIDSPLSEAPHRLIREGARPVFSIEEVLASIPSGLSLPPASMRRVRATPALDREESRILDVLGGESLSLEELGDKTGLDMSRLSLIMFGLEIKDLVISAPGQRYGKKDH